MDLDITHTIRDIDEKEWNALVGTRHIERSHAWFRTVEDSGMRKMQYVLVREKGTLKAGACSFPFREKMYIELPFVVVRSPLGTACGFFSQTPEHARVLMQGLEHIRTQEKAQGFLFLDLLKGESASIHDQVKGFTEVPMSENTYIDLHFNDFKDYLKSLSRKRRKNIRNTLNKARERWKIEPVFTNELSQWKEVAHRLQGYMCQYHNEYTWHLTEQFYTALEKNMKDSAEMLLFFKDDTPILFALSVNSPEVSLYKFVGQDPAYRDYQAYFLMYYEGIKRAIERGQKRIYFGPTAYEFKEKIGCVREELYGLVKIGNPVLNMVLKSYVGVSRLVGRKF